MSRKMIVNLTDEEKKREEFLFNFEPKIGNYDRDKFLQTMPSQTKTIIVERALKSTKASIKPSAVNVVLSKSVTKRGKLRKEHKKEYLDLGHGYKIRHRPGSAYSIFYKTIIEKCSFDKVIGLLNGNIDLSASENAKNIFNMIAIPIDKIGDYCRQSKEWNSSLEEKRIKSGKKGLIEEMIATCSCSYSSFIKNKPGNKNVQKFKEAGLVFRKYKKYLMMYPEKHESKINDMIRAIEWCG